MLPRTALALLLLAPAVASAQGLDTAVSAVVRISGTRGGTPVRGSGFVVGLDADKATIITASHVVEGVQQLEVSFGADRTESYPAGTVLGMELGNQRGLAVFLVRGALPAGVTTLSFETAVQPELGEDLFLLGFPNTATAPRTVKRIFSGFDGNILQLDLPAGEGFSGAPVLRKGRVVGIVVDEDPQLTFAVKALMAQGAVLGWGGKFGDQRGTPVPSTVTQSKPSAPTVKACVPGEETTVNGIVLVRICPGTFTMGSTANDAQAWDDEKPTHQVTLSEYWIGKTEITNAQYRGFRSDHQGEANLPAVEVSWDEAKAACERFGGRLPTEAEWEYAARAGSQTSWTFGDDGKRLGDYAWYADNSGNTTHPVGTKRANAWGVHDLHGNVWEWVADWYGPYASEAQVNPTGPATGEYRAVRGGSFASSSRFLRSAVRIGVRPSDRFRNFGFRCARGPGRQP